MIITELDAVGQAIIVGVGIIRVSAKLLLLTVAKSVPVRISIIIDIAV